VLFSEKEKV